MTGYERRQSINQSPCGCAQTRWDCNAVLPAWVRKLGLAF